MHAQLTAPQRARFQEAGYLHLPSALSAAEVAVVTDAFEETLAPYAAGVNVLAAPGEPIDRGSRTQISAAIQRHPQLCALLEHPAVVGLIGGIIGADFSYTGPSLAVLAGCCSLEGPSRSFNRDPPAC